MGDRADREYKGISTPNDWERGSMARGLRRENEKLAEEFAKTNFNFDQSWVQSLKKEFSIRSSFEEKLSVQGNLVYEVSSYNNSFSDCLDYFDIQYHVADVNKKTKTLTITPDGVKTLLDVLKPFTENRLDPGLDSIRRHLLWTRKGDGSYFRL